jgi:hypothetical protein
MADKQPIMPPTLTPDWLKNRFSAVANIPRRRE